MRKAIPCGLELRPPRAAPAAIEPPELAGDILEARRRIEAALRGLTLRQREVFELRIAEGFSFRHIARLLRITKQRAWRLYGRASWKVCQHQARHGHRRR